MRIRNTRWRIGCCSTSSTLNAVRSRIGGQEYPLKDTNFPTIDPTSPYALSPEEAKVIEGLVSSFVNCEKLQRHIEFIYKKGSMYKLITITA